MAIADIDKPRGNRSFYTIRATGPAASCVAADVRNEDDLREMIDHVVGALGRLDILVNNVGGYEEPVFSEAPDAHWTSTLDLNLRSAMLAIQHAGAERAGRSDRQHRFLGLGLAPHPGPEYAAGRAALMGSPPA
jgi:NAD(P)-dependent dehydrogenase (short-subunit alcohol dehydrogenase family)